MGGTRVEEHDSPLWSRRIRSERTARGWSQTEAVAALRAHPAPGLLAMAVCCVTGNDGSRAAQPDDFYKRLNARAFVPSRPLLPETRFPDADSELLAGTGLDTPKIGARLVVLC